MKLSRINVRSSLAFSRSLITVDFCWVLYITIFCFVSCSSPLSNTRSVSEYHCLNYGLEYPRSNGRVLFTSVCLVCRFNADVVTLLGSSHTLLIAVALLGAGPAVAPPELPLLTTAVVELGLGLVGSSSTASLVVAGST